jgi:hypothetical protein
MPASPAFTVHRLKITLEGCKPPLWRRIEIPSDASLGFLHDVIQEAFGWEGFHLHCFRDERGREWGESPMDADPGFPSRSLADEEDAALGDVLRSEGMTLGYEYDFGDSWVHRIEAEKIVPADPSASYPRCIQGRRASPPAEDIGGIWGLEAICHLVTHPEAEPPEHFEDLVQHLRENGFDPATFEPSDLTRRLSELTVRTAHRPARTRKSQRRVQRLTNDDLDYCTCGQCQAGDPVRSVAGGFLTEEVAAEPEVFRPVRLPSRDELAAAARRVPLIDDALRLAEWCEPTRAVTPKGVLRPVLARQAATELELWRRDERLADLKVRAQTLADLRSAGDLAVLDVPWQFARQRNLITICFGSAVPGPGHAGDVLDFWRRAFSDELNALDDIGGNLLPGMLSLLGGDFDSIVFDLLKLLYGLPEGEWLATADLAPEISAPGLAGVIARVFVLESMARLLGILDRFGAAEIDWGTVAWRADHAAATVMFGGSLAEPEYRMRLTPLGRHGVRELLVADGHTAYAIGDLAMAGAAELLDAVPYYDPEDFHAELDAWRAGRGEAAAMADILDAVAGTDPAGASRRVAALMTLTDLEPGVGRGVLHAAAADGPAGSREVAAGVLANLGEEPAGFRDRDQMWLLVDLLTTLPVGELPQEMLDVLRSRADDLGRCDHPAAATTLQATAEAMRQTDKALAKQLRKAAYVARSRG